MNTIRRAVGRRAFLRSSLAAAAACGPWRGVLGAADDVRVGVIGLNAQGSAHAARLARLAGVRLVALCDVDPTVLHREHMKFAKSHPDIALVRDPRALLDRKDIDAITIATPNHWHALIGVWACQAGKDAYVEKPLSHNVREGRQLVRAAARHKRIVEVGMQARSHRGVAGLVSWVRDGNLGEVRRVRGFCYKAHMPIGNLGGGDVPPGLDYDLWSGPAPILPLTRGRLHHDWRWVYEYGNGALGHQGIHQLDVARWFLGVGEIAPGVMSIGGRFIYADDGETPNTQVIYHAYDKAPLVFEVRGLPRSGELRKSHAAWSSGMDSPDGFDGKRGVGVIVECEGGEAIAIGAGYRSYARDRDGKTIREFRGNEGSAEHMQRWVEAVRTRKTAALAAGVLEGHLSSALCHTALISHRLGLRMSRDEILERLRDDRSAVALFDSFAEHLARNGVDLAKERATFGRWLRLDPAAERFTTGDREVDVVANAMLTRHYRPPFVVPEID